MVEKIKSPIIPFNGAYYDKDGNICNLDGKKGPGANASDLVPFTGVFIDSEGKEKNIDDIALFGKGGDGKAYVPGDGIIFTPVADGKTEISAVPLGFEAVTITFFNTDQYGEPI
jgi:hypothetical protein